MNGEFEQDFIDEEISGEEPLISHNHSNNNYINRKNERNNTANRTRGSNLGQRRNNSNNNSLKRNGNSTNKNKGNTQNIRSNNNNKKNRLSNTLNNNRNRGNRRSNTNSANNTSSNSNSITAQENNQNPNGLLNASSDSISSTQETEGKIRIKIPLVLKIKILLGILAFVIILLAILFVCGLFVTIFSTGGSNTQNIYTDPESQNKGYCTEIEVTFYKKIEENGTTKYVIDEEVGENGVATYDLETYVAGVVTGEVGLFDNEEALKTFAVAARTYVLYHTQDGICKVQSSDKFQVMSPSISSRGRNAAKATEGEVIYDTSGNLLEIQYDAFACYKKDEDNYYIMQGNIIPREWIDTRFPKMNSNWKICGEKLINHHGRGMSQYGAYYLAEANEYSYHEIIKYYYGEQIKGFYCAYKEVDESCDSNDESCEPVYEKVCE